ncbi:MAG: hypothetical protein KDD64_16310 [Bdellovibrionales bacterium]|nr:hypothetical protein [Bdellovibrionales bacterium]
MKLSRGLVQIHNRHLPKTDFLDFFHAVITYEELLECRVAHVDKPHTPLTVRHNLRVIERFFRLSNDPRWNLRNVSWGVISVEENGVRSRHSGETGTFSRPTGAKGIRRVKYEEVKNKSFPPLSRGTTVAAAKTCAEHSSYLALRILTLSSGITLR